MTDRRNVVENCRIVKTPSTYTESDSQSSYKYPFGFSFHLVAFSLSLFLYLNHHYDLNWLALDGFFFLFFSSLTCSSRMKKKNAAKQPKRVSRPKHIRYMYTHPLASDVYTKRMVIRACEPEKMKSILCDINSSQNETIFLTLTHSIFGTERKSKDERNIKTDKFNFCCYVVVVFFCLLSLFILLFAFILLPSVGFLVDIHRAQNIAKKSARTSNAKKNNNNISLKKSSEKVHRREDIVKPYKINTRKMNRIKK